MPFIVSLGVGIDENRCHDACTCRPPNPQLYYDALLGLVNQYYLGFTELCNPMEVTKRRAIQTIVNAIYTGPQGEVEHHSFTGGWDR